MKSCYIFSLAAICLGILAFISADLYDHDSEQEARYCKMVSAWVESEGEIGWPDYNGNFDEVCN
jgi:hypothetical protein